MKKISILFVALVIAISGFAQQNEGAIVSIWRPFQYMGSGTKAYVEINGIFIGNLASATAMKLLVPEGAMNMNFYLGNGKYEKVKARGNAINPLAELIECILRSSNSFIECIIEIL